jgi:uncharacterized hydrophobic protein (TIGR00271 family)
MAFTLFNNLSEKDKSDAVKGLINDSSPRQDFFLMIILSILMATFGLLINNITVIIGSMLIAPMLYPIMSLALGVVMSDGKLLTRSLITILKSTLFGLAAATIVTLLADPLTDFHSQEIIKNTRPSLAYAAIAIVAGLAASFALIKPQMNESMPGIAISVALIPPLAVTGIGLARLDRAVMSNGAILFIINIIGIAFAGIIIFSLMNLYVKKNIAQKAIKEDEKEIEKEIKKAEKKNGK